VFPDGPAYAASEQRRMRELAETMRREPGMKEAKPSGKQGTGKPVSDIPLPVEAVRCKHPIAMYYVPGEGAELLLEYDEFVAALRAPDKAAMTASQTEILLEIITSADGVGPEFVRRLTREHGSDGLVAIFVGGDGNRELLALASDPGEAKAILGRTMVEYLLRRYKGESFRKPRYPRISVVDK
jgi:hypothetical protein